MRQEMRLHNTLSRRKEPFEPLDGKRAMLYTCGPTVYNYAHIGNLRTYVFEDVLKRALLYTDVPVLHVMNITDVGHLTSDSDEGEDKMEKGARREGRTVWEIAEEYTDAFKDDIAKLHVLQPDIWCKATDHIEEQIRQVKQLIEKGYTYRTEDGIYFDTSKLDDYGKLAMLRPEELKAGARISLGEKRNPTDFALWKFSPKDVKRQMEWIFSGPREGKLVTSETVLDEEERDTVGFPGWHIECSAMATKYLGEQFDIHCGGIDHINVHHTNEIAQAEAATGRKPWVRFWLHGEFLVLDKGRMGKSEGNFITLRTLTDRGYDPLVYRYFCLSAHYRQQLTFSWDALENARHGYERLKTKILDLKERSTGAEGDGRAHEEAFLSAVNDDLNMPKALAALWEMLKDESLSERTRVGMAEKFDEVLGLGIEEFGKEDIPEEIVQLAEERERLRNERKFGEADAIRDAIREKGYVIEDKDDGHIIRKA